MRSTRPWNISQWSTDELAAVADLTVYAADPSRDGGPTGRPVRPPWRAVVVSLACVIAGLLVGVGLQPTAQGASQDRTPQPTTESVDLASLAAAEFALMRAAAALSDAGFGRTVTPTTEATDPRRQHALSSERSRGGRYNVPTRVNLVSRRHPGCPNARVSHRRKNCVAAYARPSPRQRAGPRTRRARARIGTALQRRHRTPASPRPTSPQPCTTRTGGPDEPTGTQREAAANRANVTS